jgi:signal transduction histidine kinase/ligand-binding sensor domain-containing protein
VSQLSRKVWQLEDGLPHNYVNAIATDENGYLLAGTQAGIVRFDGMRFTPFEHLSGRWIYSLLRASDGALWAGGYESGLYVVRAGKVESWPMDKNSIFSILEDRSHAIWAVSSSALLKIDNGVPKVIVKGSAVDGFAWQSMTEDDAGSIWFAARNGLFRVTDGHVSQIRPIGVEGLPVTVYHSPAKQQMLLGTTTGLYALKCLNAVCQSNRLSGVRGPVVALRTTSDGALWVGTWGYGVYRVDGTSVEQFSTREGFADDFVRVLSEDAEQNLWVGTRSGGLTRFQRTALKPFGIPEGLGGNYASAVVGDGADGLWLGTWRSGLFHWRNGVMTAQPLPEPVLGILINTLALGAGHDLWMGTFHGLWRIDTVRGTAEHSKLPDGDGSITSVLFSREGKLWLAKQGAGLREFASREYLLPGETITSMIEGRAGRIWIGAKGGLWRMNAAPGRQMEKLGNDSVMAMAEDGQARLWVAAEGGKIQVYTQGGTLRIPVGNLPTPSVYMIAADPRSGLWFGTGRGLAHASMQEVEEVLAGRQERLDLSVYGIAEGMRTIECRIGAQPAAWRRPDGSIWFPTAKGFVEIASNTPVALPPPHPWIERLKVDGKTVARDISIPLSPGTHELEVDFTAIRLGRAERLQFRYRMEGLDQDWVETGNERVARYSHLRPGQFHFLVAARDPGGEWSDPVSSAAIEQSPFVYQTFWFRLFAVLGLAGLGGLLYRVRLRAVSKRYSAVLEERNRIAREWHDTLLAGLAAASWQLDVAAAECLQTKAARSIKSALGMVRYCRDEARRAIDDLRHDQVEGISLADSLRESVDQLTSGTSVRSRLEIDGRLPDCSAEINLDLLRICHEATVNAMQHAHAKELVVRVNCESGNISLSVQDDGIGMNSAWIDQPPHGHYGLLGMRERARRSGGEVSVSSQPGRGTIIKATIPIR